MGERLDDTVIIRIDNGVFVGSESTNPTIHRVAIIADGRRERLATVRRPATEEEIAEAVRAINDCERMDAWNALDEARELVAETELRSARACVALAERLRAAVAARIPDLAAFLVYFDELMPMVDEAERRHSEALTALRGLKDLRHRAAAVLGAEGASGGGALSMGYDQQPQITIERRESAHR
jgi:hypothetical protein